MIILVVEFFQHVFQLVDILQSACFRNISAVQQDMDADFIQPLLLRFLQHCDQMIDMGMNVAVRQQSQEMHLSVMSLREGNGFFPGSGFIDLAALDRFVDQLGALRIDLPAAERVMSDFGVAHIAVGRKSDSSAAGFDRRMRPFGHQFVQLGFIRVQNGIAHVFLGPADAVHNN